jgi:transposase
MAKASLWVGLDIGADEIAVCETDDRGTVVLERAIECDGDILHALLRPIKRRIKLISLESGSTGIPISRSLGKRGYPLAVFEAGQASKFLAIRKNKTDRNDARGLADLGRVGRDSVSEVRVKTPECQQLRTSLITRQKLVQLRVALEGMIRSNLRLNGARLKKCRSSSSFRREVANAVKQVRKSQHIDLSEVIEPLLKLTDAVRAYVAALDTKLEARAKEDPVCSRLLKIPGVGPLTALSFYSSIEDPTRFHRNSDVGAYLGLVPMVRQSGKNISRRRISKAGDKMTRAYLTTAAKVHLRHADSALATWGSALSGRLKRRSVHTAVARKLAVTMLSIWKSEGQYHPYHRADPRQSEDKVETCRN